MNNKKFEMMTYECQIGMYFSDIEKLENGFVVYSTIVEDEHWNFFAGFNAKTIEEFEKAYASAKEFLNSINRKPCFVVSPNAEISAVVAEYIASKHTKFSIDSTMLTSNFASKKIPDDYTFKMIDNNAEKEMFINTFKTSKSQTCAGDTYAALPEYYFSALEKSFESEKDWKYMHFLSLYKGEPVGMVSVVAKGEHAGLYGGGTYLAHRGKGVFSGLLSFVENELKKTGVKYFFGITEKDSYNERLYNSLGWETKFVKEYYK